MNRLARLGLIAGTAAGVALCAVPMSVAQNPKIPSTLTFTAYDTGSSGFNIAVAVGKMFKDKHNADVRVLPAGNDVARLTPLKTGRAQTSAMGIGTYFAQEGVFEFAVKEWGPQPLRLMLAVDRLQCHLARRRQGHRRQGDQGPQRQAHRHRRRLPGAQPECLCRACLRRPHQGDVKLVEFSSYGAMWKGMLNNEVDAAIASNISGQVKEVETSPRGIVYPPTPAADKEGWARLHKIGPYFLPHKATCGAGIPQGGSAELPSYAYPIFMTYAEQPADLVYGLTKAMIVDYDAYKDGAPGAAGLDVKRQNLAWVVPYHEGAVKALKEAEVWNARARGAQPEAPEASGDAG